MNTYPTRTVEGMTRIPLRTIQDYIRDFRDHFSEEARKPVKGRRLTAADISKLETIKRLRADGVRKDQIEKVLSGEVEMVLAHQFDDRDIKDMAANSLEYFERANDAIRKANQLIREANAKITQLETEKERLRSDYRALRDRVDNIHSWQIFVMKEIPELNPTIQENKKGMMAWLKGNKE